MKAFTLAVLVTLAGCAATLATIDDPELADVSAKLAKCRADARGVVQTATPDANPHEVSLEAYAAYQACKADAGLGGVGSDGGP